MPTLRYARPRLEGRRFIAKSSFGKRLFDARNGASTPGHKVTQAMVGKIAGVSGVAVGAWEKGQSKPDLEIIPAIAEYLGVSPLWLAWGIETRPLKEVAGDHPRAVPVVGTANADEKPAKKEPEN